MDQWTRVHRGDAPFFPVGDDSGDALKLHHIQGCSRHGTMYVSPPLTTTPKRASASLKRYLTWFWWMLDQSKQMSNWRRRFAAKNNHPGLPRSGRALLSIHSRSWHLGIPSVRGIRKLNHASDAPSHRPTQDLVFTAPRNLVPRSPRLERVDNVHLARPFWR